MCDISILDIGILFYFISDFLNYLIFIYSYDLVMLVRLSLVFLLKATLLYLAHLRWATTSWWTQYQEFV